MILNLMLEQSSEDIDVEFDSNDDFDADFGEVIEALPETYKGEYTVKPKTTEQELDTAGKLMQDDVRILSIPYFNVANTSGGNTVYIGTEEEMTII